MKEYDGRFDYSSMDKDTEEEMRDMMTRYRHVWHNETYPEQFQAGVDIPPIKIELKADAPTIIKSAPRRMNEEN